MTGPVLMRRSCTNLAGTLGRQSIHGGATDIELILQFPNWCALTLSFVRSFLTSLALSFALRPNGLPAAFAAAIPSLCRSRIIERSNSATAPSICNRSFCIASVPPENVSDSLRNSTVTPLSFICWIRLSRSARFRASRSIEWTTTVSSPRT